VHVAHRLPDVGDTIGEYKIVGYLGAGGLGVVFKVERGGRFFAMKFLDGSKLDGRGKREIAILNHLDNPRVVRYVGSDYWPDPATGHPFIVMEFVPGDTLDAFAERKNPNARKVVQIVLDAACTLGEVHSAGVFHRDLKPSNIIIRGAAEQPTLIDFGVGSLMGFARLTGSSLPPGTEEFRSPEALRFHRENKGRMVQYEYGVADELWALGVCFYWLLTDTMPFGERSDDGGVEGLHERILTQRPEAPHTSNPRVPPVVSALCSRMLDAQPDRRFAHVPELCSALREAMRRAADDASWDVPLFDPEDPQANTTADDPERMDPNDVTRAVRRWVNRRPRRGRVRLRAVDAEAPAVEDAPQMAAAAPELGDFPSLDGEPPSPVHGPPRPFRSPVRWLVAILVVVVFSAVFTMLARVGSRRPGFTDPDTARVTLRALLAEFDGSRPTVWGVRGNEMASPVKPQESLVLEGASLFGAQLPAPTPTFMFRPTAQTMKTEPTKTEKPRVPPRVPFVPTTVAVATLASCSLLAGCTGTTQNVRIGPPDASCPSGWETTHAEYRMTEGHIVFRGFKGVNTERAPLREGIARVNVDEVGQLPAGSVLSGEWVLGESRYFGTFREVEIPGHGRRPVCLVVGTRYQSSFPDDSICPAGIGYCPAPGSQPGRLKSFTRLRVYAPNRI
jgi:eukaryotic-like serine/threonine-protein kinase